MTNEQRTERGWQPDGWVAGLRLGLVVPHADIGPESEFRTMAPPQVMVYANRVHFSAMRAGGRMDETIAYSSVDSFTAPGPIDDCVEQLAAAPLDVLACAFTSSAYRLGLAGEAALLDRLVGRCRGIPLTTTTVAIRAALAELSVGSIGLVNPPWFDAGLDEAGARYFETAGHRVRWHAPAGIPSDAPNVAPAELAGWIRQRYQADPVEVVLVAGNGLRAAGMIDRLESELGCVVLTANQVLLWHALRVAGRDYPVTGYGRLLDRTPVLR